MELVNAFEPLVLALADALHVRGWRMASAESCTGGLIAAACTSVAGSSDWFERGFVTYSNEAKQQMLGVDAGLIARGAGRRRAGQAGGHGVAGVGHRGGAAGAAPAVAGRPRCRACGHGHGRAATAD